MRKLLLLIFCWMFIGLEAQTFTASENYIYTKTHLTADGTKKAESITYYDGLGRPKQTIAIKASPTGKDLVTPILYDEFGRQAVEVLPFPMTSKNGGYQGVLTKTSADAFYGDKAYAEKVFENSPLDRVLEQKQTGNAWNGHSVHFAYDANVANEVVKYTTITTWSNGSTVSKLVKSGNYPAATLYKNTVTDEDGNPTIEFKNGEGQTLLVRKNEGSTDVDTYYVYNEYNQLAFVISPLAAATFKSAANFTKADTDATIKNLCYVYRYDGKGRLVEKKLPGKDWEYMVYDKLDRLVLTQDGNLRATGDWLFTKHDTFGRVIYTGIAAVGTRTAAQTAVEAKGANIEKTNATGVTLSGLKIYYTNSTAYPTTIKTLLTVNYYDSYPTGSPSRPATIISQTTLPNSSFPQRTLKGLPVATYVKNIEDDGWTKTWTWYDDRARPIGTRTTNHLGGYTTIYHKLDFDGTVLNTNTYHKRTGSDAETLIKEVFTYDNQRRLTKHTHQVGSGAVETLAENTHDDIGRLKTKKVGGTLQTVDYTYNVKSWLTKINDPVSIGSDLFALELKYENPTNTSLGPKRYNGNISELDWKTAYTGSDGILRRYGYQYDGLNRLKQANYQEPTQRLPQPNYYNEGLTYDTNGNIKTLKRYQKPASGTTALMVDNLTYTYTGNQVTKIADATGNTIGYPGGGGAITYDANGNMLKMPDKNISNIQYNFLNLPKQITQTSGNTTYVYSADGLKVKKVLGSITTDYLDGFQYVNSMLQFVPTAEGYYDFTHSRYVYQYKDQVGNVRLSYYKNGTAPKVDKENNYYPFGLEHSGYNQKTSQQLNYKYSFQGQEKQDETGWLSFKWRNYMPDVGRFFNVDPLSEKYVYNSPYAFSENRVIDARELEGLEKYIVTGRSFIPQPKVSNPIPWSKSSSYQGDDRYKYQANASTFRTEQSVLMNFDQHTSKTITNVAAGSVGYDKNGIEVERSAEQKAGTVNHDISDGTVSFKIRATNALAKKDNPLTPMIDGNFDLRLTPKPDGSFNYDLKAKVDGFPAFEVWVTDMSNGNNFLLFGRNPIQSKESVLSLYGTGEHSGELRGNSEEKRATTEVLFKDHRNDLN